MHDRRLHVLSLVPTRGRMAGTRVLQICRCQQSRSNSKQRNHRLTDFVAALDRSSNLNGDLHRGVCPATTNADAFVTVGGIFVEADASLAGHTDDELRKCHLDIELDHVCDGVLRER